MVLKLWDVDNGKVAYLKHVNNKNESRLVKLKEPMECDKIPLSKLDSAIDLMFEFISSIKKFDSVGIVNSGKDDSVKVEINEEVEIDASEKVEVGQNRRIYIRPVNSVEAEPKEKVEKLAWEEEYDKDNGKDVPQEVNDKLNLLLQEDGGKKDGAQFLINKNTRKCVDTDNSSLSPSNGMTDIALLRREDVAIEGKPKKERKKRYSKYREAIIRCVPRILKDISDSNDAKTLVNSSDLAERMGDKFVGIDPDLLYANIIYKFPDYGIIVTKLSPDETDIYANKGKKVFRFRLAHDRDKLPDSVSKQRNKVGKYAT